MVPPPCHNTVEVCNQITLLILYYISSRLINLLQIVDATIQQVPDIFYLTVNFNFLNFSFQIFLILFLKYLLPSRLPLFRLPTLLWFESCTH